MPTEFESRISAQSLKRFCARALEKLEVSPQDARIVADVLVEADLRGIPSHGMARLGKYYADRLRLGAIIARPQLRVLSETQTTATIDAGAGLGHPVAYRAMQEAIKKALNAGTGFVAVRNSNHYGIAGYYAMMALEHNCIGFSMTNGAALVVPTYARVSLLGTNPIAVAAPAGKATPFVLDMSTSTVTWGKLELAERLEKPIDTGWAIDQFGRISNDAHKVMEGVRHRIGGGLLPLGGVSEILGGHKGYGLALWVDIFTGILAGAAYSTMADVWDPAHPTSSNVGHFFGAWRIDAFRPIEEFKAAMDDLQRRLEQAPKVDGQERIYIHGQKELENTQRNQREGIPFPAHILADLRALAHDLHVEYDLE